MTGLLLVAALLGAPAVDAGLLLGLDDGAGLSRRPSTFWISSHRGQVSLVRLKNRLLVPRRDGFWWMDVDPARGAAPAAWAARRDGKLGAKWHRPPEPPLQEDAELDEDGCTESSRSWLIEFVNDRYVALSQDWGSSCWGRSSRSLEVRVVRYGAKAGELSGPAVPASDLLEGLGPKELRQPAAAVLGADAPESDLDPLSWSIQRGFGRWQARGAFIAGSGTIDWRNDFDLPRRFRPGAVRNPGLTPAWDVILAAVPDALDAFASPNGGLLVVLTEDEILAYVPAGGDLSRPALRWPIHNPNRGTVVMVEWATGRHVARWDRAVRDAEAHLKGAKE